jgi:hypothetical protein
VLPTVVPAGTLTQVPVGDETMELPIFREVESVWFRTRHRPRDRDRAEPAPVPVGASADAAETAEFATVRPSAPTAPYPRPGATGTTAGNAMGDGMRGETTPDTGSRPLAGAAPGNGWQTAADEGWRAASTAADVVVQERTAAGLPKRRPMAQLVPGGVEKATAGAQRRSPEAVRGLLSAYHRGVQRGREQATDDELSGSGGSPST